VKAKINTKMSANLTVKKADTCKYCLRPNNLLSDENICIDCYDTRSYVQADTSLVKKILKDIENENT